MSVGQSEHEIQNDILRWFADHRPDILIWRNTVGTFHTVDIGRTMQIGLPGSSDLIGILPDGRFLGVEVKSAVGVQRKNQIAFQRAVEKRGGLYVLARSVSDVRMALVENSTS